MGRTRRRARARARALAGDGRLHVGAPGAGADQTLPCPPLRHARPRAVHRRSRTLLDRAAREGRARPPRRPRRLACPLLRALDGRGPRDVAGCARARAGGAAGALQHRGEDRHRPELERADRDRARAGNGRNLDERRGAMALRRLPRASPGGRGARAGAPGGDASRGLRRLRGGDPRRGQAATPRPLPRTAGYSRNRSPAPSTSSFRRPTSRTSRRPTPSRRRSSPS
jgi:hypothetical protein